MKRQLLTGIILLLSAAVLLISATSHQAPKKPTPLKLQIPDGWPKPATDIFAGNPLTEEGFQLGRKLFYDGRLSRDGNFSCASCHQQYAGFANFDHDFSHGFNNSFTNRNAPGLFNIAWMQRLHWDGSITHIEVQPLAPISAPNEMAEEINHVLDKLRADTTYLRMFKAAFGTTEISAPRMMKAIAQFVGSIVSCNSKYDKVKKKQAFFTATEELGYSVYKTHCSSCHPEPLFTDNSFRNNGLPLSATHPDAGLAKVTGLASDSFKFKVPSLRNVALTVPYMHDGRFSSISEVIDHYQQGINQQSATLDSLLRKPLRLSTLEKNALGYFLNTLTDTALIRNPRYTAPGGLTVILIHPH